MLRQPARSESAEMSNSYSVFDVGEFFVSRQEGLSEWWARLSGQTVSSVIDINRNGIPDSGDSAVLSDGTIVDNAQFDRPLFGKMTGTVEHQVVQCSVPRVFTTREIPLTGVESLFVSGVRSVSNYAADQWRQASEMASGISEHPVLAATMAVGILLLMRNPYVAAMTGVVGGLYATGMIVVDRYHGYVDGAPMGQHDLAYGLAMLGAVPFAKGLTPEMMSASVEGAVVSAWARITSYLQYLDDLPPLLPVFAVAANGILIPMAMPVAAVGAVSGSWGRGAALLPAGAALLFRGPAAPEVLKIDVEGVGEKISIPLHKPSEKGQEKWSKFITYGEGKKQFRDITNVLNELEAHAGKTEELTQLRAIVDQLKTLGAHYVDDGERYAVVLHEFRTLYAEIETIYSNRTVSCPAEAARAISDMLVKAREGMRSLAWKFRVPHDLQPKELEDILLSDTTLQRAYEASKPHLLRFSEIQERALDGRTLKQLKTDEVLFEYRNHGGGGSRIYFTKTSDGRPLVLRMGNKNTQERTDIAAAVKRVQELRSKGLLGVAPVVLDDGVIEPSAEDEVGAQ